MLEEEVNSLNYNIETVNKLVYIIGIARNEKERISYQYCKRCVWS